MIVVSETIEVDGWVIHVEILSINNDHWMKISQTKGESKVVRLDHTFKSLKSLSSSLRCTLGLRDAEIILEKAEIPQTSDLWFLNYR